MGTGRGAEPCTCGPFLGGVTAPQRSGDKRGAGGLGHLWAGDPRTRSLISRLFSRYRLHTWYLRYTKCLLVRPVHGVQKWDPCCCGTRDIGTKKGANVKPYAVRQSTCHRARWDKARAEQGVSARHCTRFTTNVSQGHFRGTSRYISVLRPFPSCSLPFFAGVSVSLLRCCCKRQIKSFWVQLLMRCTEENGSMFAYEKPCNRKTFHPGYKWHQPPLLSESQINITHCGKKAKLYDGATRANQAQLILSGC
ncbi:hypothetical protein NDU88_000876 [Pleurodeles waltl]|uniref:Uncharacterized protein n=1 Tax=Pleurodeles waltl TaxID=8319 RepID=A0AAV7L7U8_PLEWA|nr:hypothetical protein NDU88_000876 [Pleurodeles waltl]